MGDDLVTTSPPLDARRLAKEALDLAEADPSRSLELVERALNESRGGPEDHALEGLLSWSRGLALRGLGEAREGDAALRAALAHFHLVGDRLSCARVRVSLAFGAFTTGAVDDALELLDEAQPDLGGVELAQAEMQRALILQRSGRVADSLAAFDQAVRQFELLGLRTAEAKARGNRGIVLAFRGDYAGAEADLEAARAVFADDGDRLWSMFAMHNLGFVAARQGNLPRALRLFDEAQREARTAGLVRPEVLTDRVETMLDAGLASEARLVLVAAIAEFERQGLKVELAEGCYLAARASEEDGDTHDAHRWAERAMALFAEQDRPRFSMLAEYRMLRAELADRPSKELAGRLAELADRLQLAGWWLVALEATSAAAALAADVGDLTLAGALIDKLRPLRRRASALARLDTWVAEARVRRAAGEPARAERALAAGFRALDDFRSVLGSLELRTRANQRGQQAASLGVALAIDAGRPARALHWLERARAEMRSGTVGALPDRELAETLATLRDITSQLEHDPPSPREAQRLRHRQFALEEIVRRTERHAESRRDESARPVDARSLRAALGGRILVEFATVEERLVGLVVTRRAMSLIDLGAVSSVHLSVTALRIALGRAALGQLDVRSPEIALAASALDVLLVEPVLRAAALDAPEGVVVVPSGPVASVPWGALPSLSATPVVVATSATAWTRQARAALRVSPPRILLVAGPDLRFAESELAGLAEIWDGAVEVLRGDDATTTNVLGAMEAADLVHIAAHGTFRDDNPLLSSIRLADGGLTGYDLQRLESTPETIVLSACDIGMSENGATGTFGLSGLLIETGVIDVVASVAPVVDESSPAHMAALHRSLRAGSSVAEALVAARAAHDFGLDGFVCFGH